MAALQTGQAQQNPYVSAIQTQYNSQLAQYQAAQKQFSDWAKKYEDYERTVAAQQQQYQWQQQQYQAYQQYQAQHHGAPKAALVQTGSHSESTRAKDLESREKALASRGKALAAREKALRNKAAKVRAEEVKEEQEQASLDAREKALAAKEKQVQVFEGELVQEQKKIWKVLRSREGAAPNTNAPQAAAAPPQVMQKAPTQTQSRPSRPMRVQVATKHHSTKQPMQARKQPPAVALTQMSNNVRFRAGHKKVVQRGTVSTHRATAAVETAKKGKSDLHVVMAANVPKEGEFEDAADSDDDNAKVQADSEDDSKGTNDDGGATADNDDLEQILLQQSATVHHKGDPVESL